MKFLEKFFQKIFVGIYKGRKDYNIYVVEISITGKKTSYYETFEISDNTGFDKYILELQTKTPVIYIAFLDTDILQGAIPTCNRHEAKKFPCVLHCKDFDDLMFHCYNDNWNIFTSRSGVLDFQEKYSSIGYDFLFSPFFLIKPLFKHDFPQETTYYIFIEYEFTTLTILNGDKLLYGIYVKNIDENIEVIENVKTELEELSDNEKTDEELKKERESEFEKSIIGKDNSDEFDDSLTDIKDTLDDLDDFQHVDELSDIDSFDLNQSFNENDNSDSSDSSKSDKLNSIEATVKTNKGLEQPHQEETKNQDEKLNFIEESKNDLANEIDNIMEEVKEEGVEVENDETEELPTIDKNFIYLQIKRSIKEFYESKLYEPDFIEKAYFITNLEEFDNDFTDKLIAEMGFPFEKITVDTPKLITNLAIDEVGYEI
jgi:hypothetical protein